MKPPKCPTCSIEEWNHAKLGCRAPGSPPIAKPAPQPKPKAAAVYQPKATKSAAALPAPAAAAKPKKPRKRKAEQREYWRKVRGPKLKGVRKSKTKAEAAKTQEATHGTDSPAT